MTDCVPYLLVCLGNVLYVQWLPENLAMVSKDCYNFGTCLRITMIQLWNNSRVQCKGLDTRVILHKFWYFLFLVQLLCYVIVINIIPCLAESKLVRLEVSFTVSLPLTKKWEFSATTNNYARSKNAFNIEWTKKYTTKIKKWPLLRFPRCRFCWESFRRRTWHEENVPSASLDT